MDLKNVEKQIFIILKYAFADINTHTKPSE
jgi:hypothetical protein